MTSFILRYLKVYLALGTQKKDIACLDCARVLYIIKINNRYVSIISHIVRERDIKVGVTSGRYNKTNCRIGSRFPGYC